MLSDRVQPADAVAVGVVLAPSAHDAVTVHGRYEAWCVGPDGAEGPLLPLREFTGEVVVSASGRRMAQGICPVCGTKLNRILGKA